MSRREVLGEGIEIADPSGYSEGTWQIFHWILPLVGPTEGLPRT